MESVVVGDEVVQYVVEGIGCVEFWVEVLEIDVGIVDLVVVVVVGENWVG